MLIITILYHLSILVATTTATGDLKPRTFVTRDNQEFVISRLSSGRAPQNARLSDLKVTTNVINLTFAGDTIQSLSSKFVLAMRQPGRTGSARAVVS